MTAQVAVSPQFQLATMSGPQRNPNVPGETHAAVWAQQTAEPASGPTLPSAAAQQPQGVHLPTAVAYIHGPMQPLYITAAPTSAAALPKLSFFPASHMSQQGFLTAATDSSGLFRLPHSSLSAVDMSPSHRPSFLPANTGAVPEASKGEIGALHSASGSLNAAALSASWRLPGLDATMTTASRNDANNGQVINMLQDYIRVLNAQRASSSLELLNTIQRQQQHLQHSVAAIAQQQQQVSVSSPFITATSPAIFSLLCTLQTSADAACLIRLIPSSTCSSTPSGDNMAPAQTHGAGIWRGTRSSPPLWPSFFFLCDS
jgi:hypothetical protein